MADTVGQPQGKCHFIILIDVGACVCGAMQVMEMAVCMVVDMFINAIAAAQCCIWQFCIGMKVDLLATVAWAQGLPVAFSAQCCTKSGIHSQDVLHHHGPSAAQNIVYAVPDLSSN
jgi:hypothetical protein